MASLHEELIPILLARIVGGELRPGDRLPTNKGLAAEFEMSPASARTGLQGLVDRGVIRVRHGRGSTVTPPGDWNVLDRAVMQAVFEVGDAGELVVEILEARRLLEPQVARLAAERRSEDDLGVLADAVSGMEDHIAATPPRTHANPYAAAEAAFHRAVLDAARNRPLRHMLIPAHRAMELIGAAGERRREGLAERRRVLEAIRSGAGDAAADAMDAHLEAVTAWLRRRRPHRAD